MAGGGGPVPPRRVAGLSLGEPGGHRPAAARPGARDPLAVADPIQDQRSWRFTLDPGDVDPVLGIHFLGEAYAAREPGYAGGISVPAIVDVPSGKLVTNDYPQITLDLDTEWAAHVRPGAPDLYPVPLRDEIDEISQGIFEDVNNGVYRAGFARTQAAYDAAYDRLFTRLDLLSERLARRRYLVGTPSPRPTSGSS